jgi:GWxTD domain-containing protein
MTSEPPSPARRLARPRRLPALAARPGRSSLAVLAAVAIAVAAGIGCLACAGGGAVNGVSASLADLANPFLGPEYSDWLVGPVSRLASADEVKSYLALHDDSAAAAFIQEFWVRRNPTKGPANPALSAFDERSEVADRKFSEGGLLGRRTDRGTILILYGPPIKTGFEVAPSPRESAIEVWRYGPTAPLGLDGKRPDELYRFTKRANLTVFYSPRPASLAAPPP